MSKRGDKRSAQSITTDDYDRKCQELKNRQYQINEQLKNYLKADENFKVTVNTVLSIASKAYELFESSKIEQKRKLINFVFSNLQLRGVSVEYSLRKPFDLMVDCTTCSEWLGKNRTQIMPFAIDWKKMLAFFPSENPPPYLSTISEEVRSADSETRGAKDSEFSDKLNSADSEEQLDIMNSYLRELVAGVLGIPASRLDINKNLMNMGLDSLMGLELKNRIEINIGLEIPVTSMLQGPSISKLSIELLKIFNGNAAEGVVEDQPSDVLDQVEELSEEEVKTLLEESKSAAQ